MTSTNTQYDNTTLVNFFNDIQCDEFCTFDEVDKELLQDVYNAIQAFRKADTTVRFNHEAVAKLFEFQDYDLLGMKTESDTHTRLTKLAKDIHKEFKVGETYGNFLEIEGSISEDDVWAVASPDSAEDADEYLIRILSGFTSWDEEDMVEYVLQPTHRELAKEFCGKNWVYTSQVESFMNNVAEALQMAYYSDCEKRGLDGDTYVIRPFFSTGDSSFYNEMMKENPAELFVVGAA
jgi:hypothetical protein